MIRHIKNSVGTSILIWIEKDEKYDKKYKMFGSGKIAAIEGTSIVVQFDKAGLKKMGYEFCMEKKLLEFI